MKTKLCIILFLPVIHAFACELQLHPTIIKMKEQLTQKAIKETNCSKEIQKKLLPLLSELEGLIPASLITSRLTGIENVSPKSIEVLSLKNFLHRHFPETDYRIEEIKPLMGDPLIAANSSDDIKIKCSQCELGGKKNIQLMVNDKSHWIAALLKRARKVLVLKTEHSPRSGGLIPDDVSEETVFLDKNEHYFQDAKHIEFYALNRFLPAGHILRHHDLRPTKLVEIGRTVELTINTQTISLKTKVQALGAGTIGSEVELVNPKTKKKFFAKVTGPNKADLNL